MARRARRRARQAGSASPLGAPPAGEQALTARATREISPREQWAQAEGAARRGALEAKLTQQLRALHLPAPERQYGFAPERRWRVDFAWPEFKVLAEVEGTTREGGRHQRQDGFEADARKYAAAQMRGWTVLRISPGMVRDGSGVQFIANMLYVASKGAAS